MKIYTTTAGEVWEAIKAGNLEAVQFIEKEVPDDYFDAGTPRGTWIGGNHPSPVKIDIDTWGLEAVDHDQSG